MLGSADLRHDKILKNVTSILNLTSVIHLLQIDAHFVLCIDVCRYRYGCNVSFVRVLD